MIPLRARRVLHLLTVAAASIAIQAPADAQERARDLGSQLPGTPGRYEGTSNMQLQTIARKLMK